MTDADHLWNEAVALAQQVFRAAKDGQPVDLTISGALAERILALEELRSNSAADDNEGEE